SCLVPLFVSTASWSPSISVLSLHDALPISLRNAIANAKGINMPKDNIKRAIKKASGEDADNYEEVTFEGYGPHGIAFFVECTTEDRKSTRLNSSHVSISYAVFCLKKQISYR